MKAALCFVLCLFSVVNLEQSIYDQKDVAALMQILRDNPKIFSSEEKGKEVLGWDDKECARWDHVIWSSDTPKRVEGLNLSGFDIEKIDLSSLIGLKNLDLSHNKIVSLSLPNSLEMIDISNNCLTKVDCSYMSSLESLVVSKNEITSILLPQYSKLQLLNIRCNQLKGINLSGQRKLISINFSTNYIKTIDLGFNHELKTIKGRNNELKTVWMPTLLKNPFPDIEIKNRPNSKYSFPRLKVKNILVNNELNKMYKKNAKEMVNMTNGIISFKIPNSDRVVAHKNNPKIYVF
ncbi:hypothetical protein K5X82_10570 [Halosquirtibacter xylanolyticus]|uniref:leucine-rich repeat domain-containing protein n=1 Tax=Halosquirtibacter xylanolyticus TaxID=3374599 RepID=UPI003748D69A|nr:hypothetical protein K5X82_10570 [Prolixibacteraceae bacterium]